MEKIIEQIQNWSFLHTLPAELAGFTMITELMQCGSQYRIFTYNNAVRHRSFSVLYDSATKDYLARVVVGLIEFCDINFITGSLERMEQLLSTRLQQTLLRLTQSDKTTLDSIITAKKVNEWSYAAKLPRSLAGFELYISPAQPFKSINGSYIVLDYSDFAAESNLNIYYNIYRDEFFGEMRIRRTPQMAGVFETKTLEGLEEKLEAHLQPTLEWLRRQCS